jgi:type I restriction enzyme M protein
MSATKGVFDFHRPSLKDLTKTFYECHDLIWKKEKISPTDAFYEFSKIMFIKIKQDAKIHGLIDGKKDTSIKDFAFSTDWIDSQAGAEPNPFDAVLFRQIRDGLEKQIKEKKKKRIFGAAEKLNLRPSTIYEIVMRLQNFDLHGIDEDLNGRMFETFLDATARGRGLGQYFTPRGVVHYMTQTAPIAISSFDEKIPLCGRVPFILDGCCGSGGFLIDATARFIRQVKNAPRLTDEQREDYEHEIKNHHVYGVEATEKVSRIARLNMHLHGDGGSGIFQMDMLDTEFLVEDGMPDETAEGMAEFKEIIGAGSLKFDVILSNPPFSMSYSSSDAHEKKILDRYHIAKKGGKPPTSEKSNVLFLERYATLLRDGTGELLTIMDDTVLNGMDSQRYRDFILNSFIIIQIISLPFNAFFRAQANIKTSILHLRKKRPGEEQGGIFMAIANNIGHDDHSRDTPERNNLTAIARMFEGWKTTGKLQTTVVNNESDDESLSCPMQVFELPANELKRKRLDAFYYSPELKKIQNKMNKLKKQGRIHLYKGRDFETVPEIRKERKGGDKGKYRHFEGKTFKYFEIGDVTQDGTVTRFREGFFEDLPTRARLQVKEGDIVFAKNISSRGTTILVPKWLDGQLATTGFAGIRPKNNGDALVLWSVMESEFFRKQVYYLSITASQPELRDEFFKNEVLIPFPKDRATRQEIMDNSISAEKARNGLKSALSRATVLTQKFLKRPDPNP